MDQDIFPEQDNYGVQTIKQIKLNIRSIIQVDGKLIHLAKDHSFVVFGIHDSDYILQHFGSDGKILSCQKIKNQLLALDMMTQELVVAVTRKKDIKNIQIIYWNLRALKIESYQHMLSYNYYSSMFFSYSQIVCIIEIHNQIKNIYKMTFYRISQNKVSYITNHEYKFEVENVKNIKIFKLNKYSMLGFFSQTGFHENMIKFDTFQLNNNYQPLSRSYVVKFQLNPLKSKYLSSILRDSWLVGQGRFYFQIETSVNIQKLQEEVRQKFYNINSANVINRNKVQQMQSEICNLAQQLKDFQKVHNILWNSYEDCFKKIPFKTERRHRIQFVDNLRQVPTKQKLIKPLSQRIKENIQTKYTFGDDYINAQIYYLCPESLKVLAKQSTLRNYKKFRMSWSNIYNSNMVIIKRNFISNQYIVEVVQTPFQFGMSILSAFMLSILYDNFDENLLQSVVLLLKN